MKEKNAGKIYNLIVSVAAIACMWLVWLIAWIVVDDGYVVPSVGDSLSQFFSLLGTADAALIDALHKRIARLNRKQAQQRLTPQTGGNGR